MNTVPLAWLWGKPQATGQIKQFPEDFQVEEDLGYRADGAGEHLLLRIRKTGCNTRFVADALARYLKVPQREVSFAGMKDRHAVTEQTFCVRLPGKQMPDMSRFTLEGCDIVETVRHQRKIRTGGLAGNHFRLVVRNMSQRDWAEQRLALLAKDGVPNYFGEQRFGRQGHNLELVSQWAEGEIQVRDRAKRSLLLSAARSEIFNQVTSERLQYQANLTTLMSGDCVQLTGRGSWFIAEQPELAEIQRRVDADELRITAPLPGRGEAIVRHQAQTFERPILEKSALTVQLLQKEKVDAARRAMLVKPVDLQWSWQDDQTLMMNFWLPAGSFATSVIRELILTGDTIEDITE